MPARLRAPDSAWGDSNQPLVPSQPTSRGVMPGLPRFRRAEHAIADRRTIQRNRDAGQQSTPALRWWNNCSHELWNHNLHYHREVVKGIRLESTVRSGLLDQRVAWQAEDPLANLVALDLRGAAFDGHRPVPERKHRAKRTGAFEEGEVGPRQRGHDGRGL